MDRSTRARAERQWKLSATLLGLVALVAAGLVVEIADFPPPWGLVSYFATIAIVLVGGTLWLVPRRSMG